MSDTGSQNVDPSKQNLIQNAGNIIGVIAVALAAFFGWQYFQQNKGVEVDTIAADKLADIQQLNQSITSFNESEISKDEEKKAIEETQFKAFDEEVNNLVNNHKQTVYAWQGIMIKSRQLMDKGEFAAASESLKLALEIDLGDAGLKAITVLRYAQSLLADNHLDEALSIAKQEMPNSFAASQQELLGDIYQAKGDTEQAIRAYENAWQVISARKENRAVLALKMESLGIDVKPIQEDSIIDEPKPVESMTKQGMPTHSHGEVNHENTSDSNEIEKDESQNSQSSNQTSE